MTDLRIGLDARPYLKTRTGVERFAEQIALGIKAVDPNVTLVFFADAPLDPAVKARLPGQFIEVPPSGVLPRKLFDFWITRALPPHLKAAQIDVFYSISTKFPIGDVPVVTTVHGMEWFAWPTGYSRVERLKQAFWMRMTLRRAARIVTFAQSSRADIARFSKRGGEKLRVTSEAATAHFVQRDVQEIDPFFLIVGSLELRKNLDRVIDAYRAYAKDAGDKALPLKIAGKDAWRSDSLRTRVRELGLDDKVTFLGFVPDDELVTLYNQCRALVFLSLYEGFGLPIVEAMACGAPVLTSNVSSMPEVAGEAACVVDPQDATAIKAALHRLTTDLTYVAELQRAGPKRAAHYSWERAGREVLDVLKEAAHVS
jgi:glycosyltransferase involved in cell wall biosynthesis